VDGRRLAALSQFCAARILKAEPRRHWQAVALILLDNPGMREANRRLFGAAHTTDVISCAYAPHPDEGGLWEGEILVNAQLAAERAASGAGRLRRSVARELALYVAHGWDHLGGADDASAVERRRMRQRELRWLRQADQRGLLKGLIRP